MKATATGLLVLGVLVLGSLVQAFAYHAVLVVWMASFYRRFGAA